MRSVHKADILPHHGLRMGSRLIHFAAADENHPIEVSSDHPIGVLRKGRSLYVTAPATTLDESGFEFNVSGDLGFKCPTAKVLTTRRSEERRVGKECRS